jgi:hypothetical protein
VLVGWRVHITKVMRAGRRDKGRAAVLGGFAGKIAG